MGDTSQVGSYPSGASPYGVMDMAGNVWEWVNDWFGDTYYAVSPYRNPTGSDSGTYRAMRGGVWYSGWTDIRTADRNGNGPGYRNYTCGFRGAASPGQ